MPKLLDRAVPVLQILDQSKDYQYLVNYTFHTGDPQYFKNTANHNKAISDWLNKIPMAASPETCAKHIINNMAAAVAIDMAINKWKTEKVDFQYDWSKDLHINLFAYFGPNSGTGTASSDGIFSVIMDNTRQFFSFMILIDPHKDRSQTSFLDRKILLKGLPKNSNIAIEKTVLLKDLNLQIVRDLVAECGK